MGGVAGAGSPGTVPYLRLRREATVAHNPAVARNARIVP